MAVHVDPALPVHPLTVDDLDAMVAVGILGEDDRVELLDGVLVEMTPPGDPHIYALSELNMRAVPAAAAAGLKVTVQDPLYVGTALSQPQPDLAIVAEVARDRRPRDAVLVVEVSSSTRRVDLGRKAAIYAAAGVPEYWVLDVEQRELVIHREPGPGGYASIRRCCEAETVVANGVALTVTIADLL